MVVPLKFHHLAHHAKETPLREGDIILWADERWLVTGSNPYEGLIDAISLEDGFERKMVDVEKEEMFLLNSQWSFV